MLNADKKRHFHQIPLHISLTSILYGTETETVQDYKYNMEQMTQKLKMIFVCGKKSRFSYEQTQDCTVNPHICAKL